MTMMRAAIYARFSSDLQSEKSVDDHEATPLPNGIGERSGRRDALHAGEGELVGNIRHGGPRGDESPANEVEASIMSTVTCPTAV